MIGSTAMIRAKNCAAGMILAALAVLSPGASADEVVVPADGRPLQAAIDRAAPGAILRLGAGVHIGPVIISRPLTLIGGDAVVVRGPGTGSVITVNAPDTTLQRLGISGSGLSLETQDAGVFLGKQALRAQVLDNRLVNNLFGVYVWGANDAQIVRNTIVGRADLRMNERGNGVQVWNAPGAAVIGNRISLGRDGIFVTTSKNNIFRGNRFSDLRIAVHYMYTNNSVVEDNLSQRNHIGFAMMFSKAIKVRSNWSRGDRDRGIFFNFANGMEVVGNRVTGGATSCLFIYNSHKNIVRSNYISGCDMGIHFTAGSQNNTISGNAFVGNRTQVKYVGTRWLEWSRAGRGNFWSDNPAFDLNNDGIADTPFRPNDLTDQIVWQYPGAKLLLNSPALKVLKWAQSAFPALHPGGVIDSAPLMRVPENITLAREAAQ
ncbi:MAG: nitrous oxide reductase family maturation protein NosD [Alphaproteobacteria bacterium]